MMRIIFVRHGHPDYEKNCLTEIGHKQADAAAQRLSGETVEAIYSSHYGRALETAAHIAARHHAALSLESELGRGTSITVVFDGKMDAQKERKSC